MLNLFSFGVLMWLILQQNLMISVQWYKRYSCNVNIAWLTDSLTLPMIKNIFFISRMIHFGIINPSWWEVAVGFGAFKCHKGFPGVWRDCGRGKYTCQQTSNLAGFVLVPKMAAATKKSRDWNQFSWTWPSDCHFSEWLENLKILSTLSWKPSNFCLHVFFKTVNKS